MAGQNCYCSARTMTDDTEVVLRVAAGRAQADEWALVLASGGFAHRVEPRPDGVRVVVLAAQARAAAHALDAYERENQPPAPPPPAPIEYGPTRSAIVTGALLLAFFLLTGPRGPTRWFDAGGASAARILHGEIWRTVTALTLHADLAHVAGNAAACAVFGTALCRAVGPGVGLWLMLLAGAGGNLLNAVWRGNFHIAVGASTAIFGAVGALGGLQLTAHRRAASRWRAWAPVAAALGLLALLGTGEQSDVLAHLFGFAVGGGLGAATPRLWSRPLRPLAQWVLTAAALLAVVAAWWRALA